MLDILGNLPYTITVSWWITPKFGTAVAKFNETAKRDGDRALPLPVRDYLERLSDKQEREAASLPVKRQSVS